MEKGKHLFGMKFFFIIACSITVIGLYILPVFAAERVGGHDVHGEFHTIKGVIEEVSHDNIMVLQKYYNVGNASIKNKRGRIVSKDVLKRGAEVEVRVRDNDKVVTEVKFLRGYIHE
jgi:hypothetical protein